MVISSIFNFTKYILLFIVDGTSDDLDIPIKEVFLDSEYVKKHNLCSINSINWARIMVQVGTYNIPTCFDKQNLLCRIYFYFRLCIISIAISNVDYLLVIQSISLSPQELLEILHVSIVHTLQPLLLITIYMVLWLKTVIFVFGWSADQQKTQDH